MRNPHLYFCFCLLNNGSVITLFLGAVFLAHSPPKSKVLLGFTRSIGNHPNKLPTRRTSETGPTQANLSEFSALSPFPRPLDNPQKQRSRAHYPPQSPIGTILHVSRIFEHFHSDPTANDSKRQIKPRRRQIRTAQECRQSPVMRTFQSSLISFSFFRCGFLHARSLKSERILGNYGTRWLCKSQFGRSEFGCPA